MKITGIECHVLVVPQVDAQANSSAQDNLVVEIHTDAGITGIGETDTNPWIGYACIKAPGTHIMGLRLEDMLIGADPMQPEALWHKLYTWSKMTGRRGALICAMGAIDMALWDIKGKALGLPIYQLLGGAVKDHAMPYATLLPTGRALPEYQQSLVAELHHAKALGFHAAKLEVCINGPYAHNAVQGSNADIIKTVAMCREAIGPDFVLMVDVAYAFPDAWTALDVLKRLAEYDLFFLETPIDIDDLAGHAFLHDRSPIRIAAGEWQNTHFEFIDLVVRGKVDVLQPDVGRVGGFTEARKVCQLAADTGRIVVPHCWKTGIGIAASMHLVAAYVCAPYLEYAPAQQSESVLRRELVDDLPMVDGKIPLPDKPGLGVTLNRDVLNRYRVDPAEMRLPR